MNHQPPSEQVIAGKIARNAIRLGQDLCRSEIDASKLDQEIETFILDCGGKPALKGYHPSFSSIPYLHTICLARDNEAVHGPPVGLVNAQTQLVTIDLVVEYDGWFADTARTFTQSQDPARLQLVHAVESLHTAALEVINPDGLMSTYGAFCEDSAKYLSCCIVRQLCGHGIGRSIHQSPAVLCVRGEHGFRFEIGKSYAVEPVIAQNLNYRLSTLDDKWTLAANCLTAHMEDTIFISNTGIINLTI
jgi:methionyl aminopeptidase